MEVEQDNNCRAIHAKDKTASNSTVTPIDETNVGFGKSKQQLRTKATRRSLSGAPLTCLFETKFQHLKAFQKKQNETRGLNFLLAPTTSGAFYRSSLPVTPIGTPLFNHGLKFTEQSLHNRILMHRNRLHSTSAFKDQQDHIAEVSESLASISSPASSQPAKTTSRLAELLPSELPPEVSESKSNKQAGAVADAIGVGDEKPKQLTELAKDELVLESDQSKQQPQTSKQSKFRRFRKKKQ